MMQTLVRKPLTEPVIALVDAGVRLDSAGLLYQAYWMQGQTFLLFNNWPGMPL